MILYPALDLRGGKVVRLRQGDPAQQTVYGDDPLAIADRWIAAGATWLHVVNLDGAFSAANGNEAIVKELVKREVPIQFGGGLRSLEDVQRANELGVARIVLGTLAVEHPDILAQALAKHGSEKLSVALDARDGQVATHGWQTVTGYSPIELGQQMKTLGIQHILYTDVSRDGQLIGVNVTATVELAKATGLNVIASGGVKSLDDIIALRDSQCVAGAILGTALYEGLINLTEALDLVKVN